MIARLCTPSNIRQKKKSKNKKAICSKKLQMAFIGKQQVTLTVFISLKLSKVQLRL